ncbi:MAG TPA: septation protein SepH [Acidimicrobiales bacterium]|nr:septation protein SepH [Acidimicrobiales bacterium]
MQQLHLVGLTTDHTGLILSARRGARTGKYSIAADEKLLAAAQEARRLLEGGEVAEETGAGADDAIVAPSPAVALPPPPPAKPVSSLSPREIQGRLRAGGTVGEIAAAAGVDEEWILRFADPIRAEQARVVERAQRLTFNKSRLGPSAEPLETSVLLNLAERGVRLPADVFAMAWTAFNLHGTSWAVVFSYTSRQRRQTAQWEVDLRSGELIARNRLASDLGYLEPGRRSRRLEPLEVPGEEESTAGTRRSASAAKGTASRSTAARTAAKVTAKGTPPKRLPAVTRASAGTKMPATTKAAAARKASVKKVPASARASAAKKASAGTKAAASRKSPPAGKSPAKKVVTPARTAAVKKNKAPAAKSARRQSSSSRSRRPSKKPAAKKPAPRDLGSDAATAPAVPSSASLPERPTHLARPPSPMNPSNRAVTLPGRLVGAPSLRPPPPSAPRPRPQAPARPPSPARGPSFRPRPRPETEDEDWNVPDPDAEVSVSEAATVDEGRRSGRPTENDPPAPSGGPAENGEAGAQREAEASAPRVRKRRSERRITPRDGDKPSVVILSTPAVRRLEPAEEPRSRSQAPRS